ncbi:MAG: hypothetical protein IPH89_13935 [Bacteroidetes bacterium]|nr:hypothetical protein [Bacteroidota bacterium]
MKKISLYIGLFIVFSTCRLPVDMIDENYIGRWQNFEQCRTIITIDDENHGTYKSEGSSHCQYFNEGRARMNNSTLKIGTSKFKILIQPRYHDTIFNTYMGVKISHWEIRLQKSILLNQEVVTLYKIEP